MVTYYHESNMPKEIKCSLVICLSLVNCTLGIIFSRLFGDKFLNKLNQKSYRNSVTTIELRRRDFRVTICYYYKNVLKPQECFEL